MSTISKYCTQSNPVLVVIEFFFSLKVDWSFLKTYDEHDSSTDTVESDATILP